MLKYGPQLKGTTVYRSGSRGNEPLQPMTAQEAIDYLNEREDLPLREDTIIGTAVSDCPSGICEIGDAPLVPTEEPALTE